MPWVLLLGLAATPAAAQVDKWWDPNATSPNRGGPGTWDTTSLSWSPNADGVSGPYEVWNNAQVNNAIFGGPNPTTATVTLGTGITAHNLTFESGTAYTLTGSTLTLGGTTPTITTHGNATISSIIAGTAGLTKAGGAGLTLTGANTFSGGITVNAGTLGVDDDAALGAASNGITMANGTVLSSASALSASRVVTLSSGTITVGGVGVGSARFTGAGGLSVASGVTLRNAASDYTGQTRFGGGGTYAFTSVADLGVASALGAPTTAANGTVSVAAGGGLGGTLSYRGDGDSSNRNWSFAVTSSGGTALRNDGTGTLSLTGNIAPGGGFTLSHSFVAQTADLELLGVISTNLPRAIGFSGGGLSRTITLGSDNTFSGPASISNVTVRASSLTNTGTNSSLGTGVDGDISLGNANLVYTGVGGSTGTTDRPVTLNGAVGISNDGTGSLALSGAVTFNPAGPADTLTLGGTFAGQNTVSGVISGNGSLVMNGAASSVWLLSGANTYNGATTVNSGTLRLGNTLALGMPNAVTVNGGTLDLNGNSITIASLTGTGGSVALTGANLTVNGATSPAAYAGSLTGNGSLLKAGTGTLTLAGSNSYTGSTTVNGGTLRLDFSASGAPASNIISSASTLNMTGGTLAVVGGSGANIQSFSATNIIAGNNRITATAGSGTTTVNLGAINRTGGLVDFGVPAGGAVTMTTTNPDGALGGWATVTSGTTTDYAMVAGGNITALTTYATKDDASTWVNGDIVSDTGGAANTQYFGTVSGSVQLGGLKYTVPRASTVTVGAGNTLGVDGTIIVSESVGANNQTITGGSLTGSVGGGVLGILQNSTGNFTIASTIVDNGGAIAFTKAGTGLVTLSGANTYTGVTTLSGGTLSVSTIGNGGVASNIGASTNASSNLVLESGTLRYTGATATTDRGFTLINGGPTRTIEISNAAANLTFTGQVTGSDDATLTKTGSGTLTLANAANTYTGITTVSGGTLSVSTLANGGVASGIGASSSDPDNLVLTNGGALQYTGGTVDSDRGFTLGTGGGGIDVTDVNATLTLSGTAAGPAGTGALRKTGAGTLVLSGINTYTGGTIVDAGTLRAGSAQAFGSTTGLMTVNAGATLDINSVDGVQVGALSNTTPTGGNVTLGSATLTVGGINGTFSGLISGTGGLTKTGGGTQTLTGCNNTYTGATTINGGALSTNCLANGGQPSGIGQSSNASSNLVLFNGTLTYTGPTVTTDRGFSVRGGSSAINVTDAAATLEFTGPIVDGASAGGLTKQGPGTLVLSGNNTYTANTSVTGGTLRAGSATAFGTGGMGLANTAGVTLDLNGFDISVQFLNGGGAVGGNITLGTGTLTITNGNSQTFAGAISGAGGLVKAGGGVQALSGCNSSYGGGTTINGGTLQVNCLANGNSNSAIGASSAVPGNLVLNGGTLHYVGPATSTDRLFTLGTTAGSALNASGTGPVSFTNTGAIAFASPDIGTTLTLTGTNTGANSLAAQIDNNGTGVISLSKTGVGTWILRNANSTYTGATTISGGVLGVDKLADGDQPSSIGASPHAASNLVIGSNSVLRYTGTGDTTNRLFTLSPGTSTIESSGTGPIVFTDTGPVTLANNNQARTIALGGTNTGLNTLAGAIGNAGTGLTTLAKNDSGTWVLTGNNTYTGNTVINDGNLMIGNGGTTGNAGAGNVIVNSPTSTLSFNRGDTFNFAGTLSGPGTIAQVSTGTTVLTAAGNSIGATRIDAGTLQVDGGLTTPTVAMNGTSTLTLNGTVQAAGPVAATFTGDAGVSTININSAGTLRAIGDLGGGNDVVTVTGTLNTGAGVLNLGAGNDTLVLNDPGVLSGSGVNAGTGTDALQVNTTAGRTLDGANVTSFETLNKQGTGTLTLTGDHGYTAGVTIGAGTLQIGNGGATGTLTTPTISNSGTLAFNRSGTLTVDAIVTGSGGVNQIGGGTTVLTGNNSYAGPTNVQAGTLLINGNQSAASGLTSVANAATLGGTGTIGGNVTVASGGALNPGGVGGVPGTLTVNGNLALAGGSTLNFDFGRANVPGGPLNDLVNVGGTLTLDGTINVTSSPGGFFGPGVYRVFNYAGTLTNNGLDVTSPDYFVQTSIANQVNLVNTAGVVLNYWDGAAGPKNNGTVNGGDGVWQNSAGNDNWTEASGASNAPWSTGAFAVFQGTPGTVTVDNGLGPVIAAGMQFAVGGYVVQGGDIRLGGAPSIIRVGDGTAAGAGYVATINSNLTGATQVVKTDLGTLVLNGTNSHTGGTAINGGTLQVSSDANLGDAAGALSFDGGTLRNTAAFTTPRAMTLLGGGGTFQTDANLTVSSGIGGTGALTKTGGATLILTGTSSWSGGTVINGGTVQVSGDANLGNATGALTFNGGTLQNTTAFASARSATLNAAGGTFQTDADLTWSGVIGGAGALTKTGAANLILTGANTHTGGTTISAGTVIVGDGGANGSIVGNVINNSALAFSRSDTVTFGGTISGSGTVAQVGSGTTILTGTNTYGGPTNVAAGTLIVNGDQSGATGVTSVANGAALGGIGTIGGDAVVANGGTLNPGNPGNVPGTLTINGGLTLNSGSTLNYNFGQANVVGGAFNDHTRVAGDLVLGGTLHVTQSSGGTFSPGIYRVISYGGNLTNNGLALGATPAGSFSVQTSVANQVNLVNQTGVLLSFWDGPPPAGVNDNNIRGGDGLWRLNDNDYWTTETGAANAPFANATFAIFQGLPGTVTIDNTNGQVQASGMQFATDGYRLVGGPLELTGGQSIIRVGDGTADSAAFTTMIDAQLIGSAQLVKSDLGTLVLTGNNTYTGGTAIQGGILSVSSDANLGDASGGLTFDGGTLQNTVAFASARAVTLNAGGGTVQTEADLTLSGVIGGTGALTKTGTATLILTGDNAYTGGTTITAGTLQLGNGGTTGSIVGDVVNNSVLAFNRSDTFTVGGLISGTGRVNQVGSGTTVLTGADTYTGGTTITAGTLQLGDGGTTGSIVGDVTNNAALAFNRSDTVTFGGVISGSGVVNQVGSGTTVLTADSSYTGGTTISAGTLQLGNGGATGSIVGDVTNNAALAFNRSDNFTFRGVVSGTGTVNQIGTGTTVLTAENTYTGGTTIAAGTLQLGNGGMTGSIVGDVTNNGTLAFNRSDILNFAGVISGSGAIRQIGSGITNLTGDSSGFAGTTSVERGTLAVNGRLCGDVNVLAGGRVQGTGFICTTNNAGVVAPGNSIGTLTVVGNYTGTGGTLEIETVLGGDASPTDRLVVTGDTAGTTTVRAINVGGTGAQTVEGIKIVDVGGASNGVFTLQGDYVFQGQPAVIAGAYAYTLQKHGVSTPTDGDWYLRSALTSPAPGTPSGPLYQPGVPVYEAYPQMLLSLNGLPTLRERVGDRYWSDERPAAAPTAGPSDATATPAGSQVPQVMWGRMEGQRIRMEPNHSTSGANWEADQLKLQAGLDGLFLENRAGRLFGGLTVQYGYASADIRSVYGTGGIHVDGYSVGSTLTWASWNGFYVDGQAQATWYHSRLASNTLGRRLATNDGFGYAFGVEAGQRLNLGDSAWSLTPQAQLVYSAVDFNAFTDPFGARVKSGDGDRLTGRFGIAADYRSIWKNEAGDTLRANVYGIANLYYEFLEGTNVTVSGTRIGSTTDRVWGSLGVGGSLSWNGRAAVYGEVSAKASLSNPGDSYSYKGIAGFRYKW